MDSGLDRRHSTDLTECLQGKGGMARVAEERILQHQSRTNTTSSEIRPQRHCGGGRGGGGGGGGVTYLHKILRISNPQDFASVVTYQPS